MIAILKREFKSYYNGMMGWLLTAVLLVFGGLYFTAVNLQGGYTDFTMTLYSFVIVLLIFVPLIAMRSFAEEKRTKTDRGLSPRQKTGIIRRFFRAFFIVCPTARKNFALRANIV